MAYGLFTRMRILCEQALIARQARRSFTSTALKVLKQGFALLDALAIAKYIAPDFEIVAIDPAIGDRRPFGVSRRCPESAVRRFAAKCEHPTFASGASYAFITHIFRAALAASSAPNAWTASKLWAPAE